MGLFLRRFALKKPKVKLIDRDGNVFFIISEVFVTIRRKISLEKAMEFQNRAFSSKSYDEVLQIVMEYVEVE